MAITVKPKTLATGGPYTPTGELGPTEWNDGHEIEMASQRVLGRLSSSAGDAEELKGMWVEVSRATASNSTTIDFTGIDSTADEWMVEIYSAKGSTNAFLTLRTSSNSGSSYDNGSSDYYQLEQYAQAVYPTYGTATKDVVGSSSDTEIYIPYQLLTANNKPGLSAQVVFIRPSDTSIDTQIKYSCSNLNATTAGTVTGTAFRRSAGAVNAIRFLFFSGDIASGEFVLLKRLK